MMEIRWNDEKNSILKQTRNVSFEDVENAIMNDNILDIIPHHNQEKFSHHNQEKFSHQELMIVWIRNYTYYVPFVMNVEEIFLKNIIPSRKYHKKYNKE